MSTYFSSVNRNKRSIALDLARRTACGSRTGSATAPAS
jgi:crotonobetainyl-CoA:carnitine CoA-transferase CaiB-like acyl-CoA transferase